MINMSFIYNIFEVTALLVDSDMLLRVDVNSPKFFAKTWEL